MQFLVFSVGKTSNFRPVLNILILLHLCKYENNFNIKNEMSVLAGLKYVVEFLIIALTIPSVN